jgi:hypothetical protein
MPKYMSLDLAYWAVAACVHIWNGEDKLSVCNFGLFFDCWDFHTFVNVYCNRVKLYSEPFFSSLHLSLYLDG